MSTNINHQVKFLCDVLHESAHFMQRDFGEITNLQNSKKGTSEFAQKCYMRIKQKMLNSITEKRPSYKVITVEEKIPDQGDFYLVIEPISGITNFQHAIPFCAISIALFDRNSDQTIAIAIHNPILRETFYAGKNYGAWFENYNETIIPRCRIRVSGQNNISQAFSSFANINNNSSIINLNCDLLEIAYFSSARFDIILKKDDSLLNKASQLLIREAGGHITSKDGYFIASNEFLHKHAVERYL